MGIDLIIAMVASAGIMRGWEQSKKRSREAWDEARRQAEQRGAARERARQQRAAAWQQRLDDAKTTGPRNPLWWAYATGWLAAGTAAALAAGLAGAATGAISGARGGYKVGRAGVRLRWTYRETWTQWRTHRDWIETQQCERCGGYVTLDQVTVDTTYGRVCPDCVPAPSPEQPKQEFEDIVHERRPGGTTTTMRTCANGCELLAANESELCLACEIAEARKHREQERGENEPRECPGCGGNGGLTDPDGSNWGPCPGCNGSGRYSPDQRPCRFCARHTDPDQLDGHGWCLRCARLRHQQRRAQQQTHEERGAKTNTTTSGQDDSRPDRIHVQAERADQQEPADQKGTITMSELMPASTTQVSGTGEGYTDTVNSLAALSKLLGRANEEVQNLGDTLTANSLDSETLGQINDLADTLDTAAPLAEKLHKHVEQRHAPVADAVAGAGGSGNVATKSWYDQY